MNKPIEYNTTQLKPYQSDRVNSQSNQNRNLQNELSLPSISPVRQQVNEALSHDNDIDINSMHDIERTHMSQPKIDDNSIEFPLEGKED